MTTKRRFEILLEPDMADALDRAARRGHISTSAWIRLRIAAGLDDVYGESWRLDHPGGDQGGGKALSERSKS